MAEYDLTTKDGVAKLIDLMEERSPIEDLDATVRQRLVENGSPITIDEARRYEKLLAQQNKERGTLKKLLAQAPFFKKG